MGSATLNQRSMSVIDNKIKWAQDLKFQSKSDGHDPIQMTVHFESNSIVPLELLKWYRNFGEFPIL